MTDQASEQGIQISTRARDRAILVIVSVALLGSLGYLLVRALGGASRLVDRDVVGLGQAGDTYGALAWLIVAAVAACGAVAGWLVASARAGDIEGAEQAREQAEREAQEAKADAEEKAQLAAKAESEREREEAQLAGLRRANDEQRRWNRELSARLNELYRREGVLGGRKDVRSLVLRVAMGLLDADKGLLLSREDADDDGKLDVVAHEGFNADPTGSSLVQHFAELVVEGDEIIRIGKDEMPDHRPEEADEEIENLVAIPIYIADRFHGVVVCANGDALDHEDEVLIALGDHAGAILENGRLHGELRGSYVATVKMLADAIEVKDPFLRGHSDEVSGLVRAMASRLDLEDERREQLIFGSLLHDIGKLGVSERILLKPGPLTDEEFSAIKLHPRIGYRLVAQLPLLQPVAAAILHHHERFDGTGYPSGLVGERIPLEARVIAIIDAFSAMISDRPYQAAVPVEDAVAELERCAGTHFDPRLVRIFVEEVKSGIPTDDDPSLSLAEALDDPELQALRGGDEPMVGFGSFASTDSLTLLRSHSVFRERLQAEVELARIGGQGDELSLIVVRATNLRELNGELGYGAVDRLIEQLARQVERTAVDCGGIAGRDGGGRLAIVAPRVGREAAGRLAESIRERAPRALRVSCSASFWSEGDSAESLLEAAST